MALITWCHVDKYEQQKKKKKTIYESETESFLFKRVQQIIRESVLPHAILLNLSCFTPLLSLALFFSCTPSKGVSWPTPNLQPMCCDCFMLVVKKKKISLKNKSIVMHFFLTAFLNVCTGCKSVEGVRHARSCDVFVSICLCCCLLCLKCLYT